MTAILAIDPGNTKSGWVMRRKAQVQAAQKRYREANRDLLRAKTLAAQKADPEKHARRMREYRKRKPEVIAAIEAKRERPEWHREKFNAYRRKWAKANPDKVREHAHKRDGLKLSALPRGTLKATGERQRWRCAACEADLKKTSYHKDHIVPLALGGAHAPKNIQLLCPPCNLSKGAKHPVEFMQSKGRLL